MRGTALAIVEAIEAGADRVKTIIERTGVPQAQVYARLHELKRLGAVVAFRVEGGKGRGHTEAEKRYRVRAGTWRAKDAMP